MINTRRVWRKDESLASGAFLPCLDTVPSEMAGCSAWGYAIRLGRWANRVDEDSGSGEEPIVQLGSTRLGVAVLPLRRWAVTAGVLHLTVASIAGDVELVDGAVAAGTGRFQAETRCAADGAVPAQVLEPTDEVLTWTRVRSPDGGAIVHLYYLRDVSRRDPLPWLLVATVVLDIPAGAAGWRTWSTKEVGAGEWRVDVRDLASTDLLCSVRYVIAAP